VGGVVVVGGCVVARLPDRGILLSIGSVCPCGLAVRPFVGGRREHAGFLVFPPLREGGRVRVFGWGGGVGRVGFLEEEWGWCFWWFFRCVGWFIGGLWRVSWLRGGAWSRWACVLFLVFVSSLDVVGCVFL